MKILFQHYSNCKFLKRKSRYVVKRRGYAVLLVGPGGFEPPTSTMSRLKALTNTRKDTVNIAVGALLIETMENI